MGANDEPLRRMCIMTKMLASACKGMGVTMIYGTVSNVHTTYPLCGWTWSELATRGTKSIRG